MKALLSSVSDNTRTHLFFFNLLWAARKDSKVLSCSIRTTPPKSAAFPRGRAFSAFRSCFQKIADPSDVAPSMGLAQTINHIAAVSIPPLGGWLWVTFGYQLPFYCGMGLTLISLLLIQFMDREIARAGKRA